jgi:aspartyl-tRNA synthetase|tara:strand:+ start:1433 stop:2749 length:1317 start_codon:yes stop_codon:yes gene_type:complete
MNADKNDQKKLIRTSYSKDISVDFDNKNITVIGWIVSMRKQGKIYFMMLYDSTGPLQIIIKKGVSPDDIFTQAETLKEHSSIAVRGTIKKNEKAPNGVELHPEEISVLSTTNKIPPFSLYGGQLPNIDKRLDIRAIDLRRPSAQSIMKLRAKTLQSIRNFFIDKDYLEVNTPKIIATATEGGSALFPMLYYDKEAFLTQSPQLFKEQLVLPFEKVFEIAYAYRAEKSRTLHHISEFISVDMEQAFVDYKDVLKIIEELLIDLKDDLLQSSSEHLDILNSKDWTNFDSIPAVTYNEAIDIIKVEDPKIEWGDDLSTKSMEILSKKYPYFYYVTDWPSAGKPFYIKCEGDYSESFDLMYGNKELASGGTRVSDKDELQNRLQQKNLNPNGFEFHLRVFDYGMPPHAGFGLGFERLMMMIANQTNIREVCMFPRDQHRLMP